MILYKNFVIITPVKTGTVSLEATLFLQGAYIVGDHINFASVDYDTYSYHLDLTVYPYAKDTDFYQPHDWDHSNINMLNKQVILAVRNPYERLISYYYFFIKKDDPDKTFEDFIMESDFKKNISLNLYLLYKKSKAQDFLRLEHWREDFEKIGLKLKPDEIIWKNRTDNKPKNINLYDYYTPKVLEKLQPFLEQECILFGYEMLKSKEE